MIMTQHSDTQLLRETIGLDKLRELQQGVFNLARKAGGDFPAQPVLQDPDRIDRIIQNRSAGFTITVIGQTSSGKSSLINSVLGRRLLQPSDSPTDGVISVLMEAAPGEEEYAERVDQDGVVERFPDLATAMRFLRQQDTPMELQLACREVRFFLHEPWLRGLRIVNTPGLGDRLQALGDVTLRYLGEDEADLVIWTFFPDTAANERELGVFGSALASRRSSVLGVVTRALEANPDDEDYDPREDPSLAGPRGVVATLREQLGRYLRDVILYDSHEVRRLMAATRNDPALLGEPAFQAKLERAGYGHLRKVLDELVGEKRERVAEARVDGIVKQCAGHAELLAQLADKLEEWFLVQAQVKQEQIQAWRQIERQVIGPWRVHFKGEIRGLAAERARELAILLGDASADAIEENLGLVSSLLRSLFSWTGVCDSAEVVLRERLEQANLNAMEASRFLERLYDAMERLVKEHLQLLVSDLESVSAEQEGFVPNGEFKVEAVRTNASSPLTEAMLAALKGVISASLKALSKNLTGAAGKKAGGEVLKGGFLKYAGVVTLVLVPFDLAKLVRDFNKKRDDLARLVQARYLAQQFSYEVRLFEDLWGYGLQTLELALYEAHATLTERGEHEAGFIRDAATASGLSHRAKELAIELLEPDHG